MNKYSYGEFLRKFTNATKKQRKEAVKKFYDFLTKNKQTNMNMNKVNMNKVNMNKVNMNKVNINKD